jgi:signal transduction histidine kinase
MTTKRLKWLTFLGLAAFVGVLDVARSFLYPELMTLRGRLLLDALVLISGVFLVGLLFAFLERQEQSLERQSAELLALHHAAVDLGGELGLDSLLQKVVDGARALIGARYGALSVVDRDTRIESFVVSGLPPEVRDAMGPPPEGHGLLGIVLNEGERLRVADIAAHPRSAGFPERHPRMTTLLAVPIACRSPFRGNLYLSDKHDGSEFGESDEATLVRFAVQAANAIDAVHLHERLRALAIEEERMRLAREMHDGVAQILASVNARAQAIREHLRGGRVEVAIDLLERLAADARSVHSEVREGILALRATSSRDGLGATLRDYLDDWQDQTGIEVVREIAPEVRLLPEREVQVLRIAQEALANVHKHSGAGSVRFRLAREENEVSLEIDDDGKGFDPARSSSADGRPHFGLLTMRERAQAVDGRLDIDTRAGGGTRVRLRVPIGRGAQLGIVRRTA